MRRASENPAAMSDDGPEYPAVPPPVEIVTAPVAAPPVEIAQAEPLAPLIPMPQAEALRAGTLLRRPIPNRDEPNAWRRLLDDWSRRRNAAPSSFVASTAVHVVVVVSLGLWIVSAPRTAQPPQLIATMCGPETAVGIVQAPRVDVNLAGAVEVPTDATPTIEVPRPGIGPIAAAAPSHTLPHELVDGGQLLQRVSGISPDALEGRHEPLRSKLLQELGGTQESEAAVRRGLDWLAAHQRENGGWHFDLSKGPCAGACRDSGSVGSTTAATGLALLCFLGNGDTPTSGHYQKVVARALAYLESRGLFTDEGIDFQEGTMYAQGISSMAISEALAMTRDPQLQKIAQGGVNFILYAQDKNGGGWRYTPGQPGDTTVTGWQLMALKSARMASLHVPHETLDLASRFFDQVGAEKGAFYGYLDAGKEPTTTSVGLLCRMYLGWPRNNTSLASGVRYLAKLGPSKNDMYFNYYATQVLMHWGGAEWRVWNPAMRDFLVGTQSTSGHEAGSWFFVDKKEAAAKGGRLYNTCMAIMTLEVYYRYLPLYGSNAVDHPF